MKALALSLWLILLGGCAGAGDRSGGGGGAPAPLSPADPAKTIPLLWGGLTCQKSSACKNGVLNLRESDLMNFFEREFSSASQVEGTREFKIFLCGGRLRRAWQKQFLAWLEGSAEPFDDFIFEVLDPVSCQIKDQLNLNLQNFFKTTQEYKYEIAHR